MRSWLPVLRERRRYIVFEVDAEEEVRNGELLATIRSSENSLFGDLGTSSNRLRLISFDGRFGLLRCGHTRIEEARVILATVYSINRTRAALRVLGVSGTIKAAIEKYIPQLPAREAERVEKKIELEQISGCIVRFRGREQDLSPDDREITKRSDTQYMGLTSFDSMEENIDANDTPDGL